MKGRRPDYSGEHGALLQAESIRQYWQRRGVAGVLVAVEPAGTDEMGKPVYGLRSNVASLVGSARRERQ